MAMASNSSSFEAQNSSQTRQSRRSSAARVLPSPSNISPPPLSSSEIVDQEKFVSSSSTASSDSFPAKETNAVVAEFSCLAEDGSVATAGADALVDNSENGSPAKRPAWNKPSNGATAEVGSVMGAECWPALAESARASPKSSSTYSLKASSHGSISAPQDMAVGSLSSPKKVNTSIPNPSSTSNHPAPTRQRSMKRSGSSSSHNSMPANGSLSQGSPMPGAVVEVPVRPSSSGKSGGSVGESSRDNTQRDGGQRGGSYGGNELQQHRNSFRKNNSGQLSRGDGSYHHSNSGRRDHDRGKQDWGNHHRNFGSRESHAPHQRVASRPFLRGLPNAPFIPPSPPPPVAVVPFVGHMVYTDVPAPLYYVPGPHPESLRPMPMVPVSPVYLPMSDPNLASKIVNQIDYYFSNENLVKDTYLRRNMDSEGWVSINLIAGFKKVMQLTDNIQIILDAIQASNVVEVQGDKLRRRSDWSKWIMPPVQTPQSIPESTQTMLAAQVNNVSLDERAAT